ncbi:class I SAM-dependent methyltransferase [Acetobacterium sp. K1/6]|uniref:class I SAM-dependent methyltransferase n=1 Tax=Acetobacterium sp. K1/6 TaxID=3055467 RepID=UPI002ACAE912|nr:class I SAM-dependent methyltransferase [Acetobacterium sp. K1/6]MDZ5724898.1 class I SAM-dependent methyltransferase [Acetobacterium sp. K1/6]
MTNLKKIKSYWEEQAKIYGSDPSATTQDVFLRKIEINYICDFLSGFDTPLKVLDIGCGNGYSTLQYKKRVNIHSYVGADYSEKMIQNAKRELKKEELSGVVFKVMDVMKLSEYKEKFDIIISDRCLINLGGSENRRKAVSEIFKCLYKSGKYLLIENFIEGQIEFNKLREQQGLDEIQVRWHNSFFSKDELERVIKNYFIMDRFENISSLYYLATRVIYSKICMIEEREPDYENKIYEVASELPFIGNFGPVCACVLERKS